MNTIILPKTQHLVVFQEVIKSGSIGSAARQLGLTQPAVSKIISDIESYFGVEVMVRKNTGVKLTAAGQVLLSYAESITREMKNMVSEINSLSFSTVMDVSFGYPSLIGFTFLSGMIKNSRKCSRRRASQCMKRSSLHSCPPFAMAAGFRHRHAERWDVAP